MIGMIQALLANAKGNPIGLVLAAVALVCYGGGQKLSESAVEPFGTILQGLAGVLVLIAGAWMKKKPEEPPK
jgi:hypothetical protein